MSRRRVKGVKRALLRTTRTAELVLERNIERWYVSKEPPRTAQRYLRDLRETVGGPHGVLPESTPFQHLAEQARALSSDCSDPVEVVTLKSMANLCEAMARTPEPEAAYNRILEIHRYMIHACAGPLGPLPWFQRFLARRTRALGELATLVR